MARLEPHSLAQRLDHWGQPRWRHLDFAGSDGRHGNSVVPDPFLGPGEERETDGDCKEEERSCDVRREEGDEASKEE